MAGRSHEEGQVDGVAMRQVATWGLAHWGWGRQARCGWGRSALGLGMGRGQGHEMGRGQGHEMGGDWAATGADGEGGASGDGRSRGRR